ncbi:MAG: F0F1 ATP synthase subunit gamma [Rickettsiaceae bacterium]|nr:F0F1 ATP synthase subunit gamma [Rickettsiaceae bacterium]
MKNLKQLRSRIKVIADIKKTTKAMQLIAASKLQHLKQALEASNMSMLSSFDAIEICLTLYKYLDITPETYIENLLLNPQYNVSDKKLILLIASDQGLCGTYNHNLFKFTNNKFKAISDNPNSETIELFTYGKKAAEFSLRNFKNLPQEHFIATEKNLTKNAQELTTKIFDKFISGNFTEIVIYSNHFKNMLVQECTEQLLIKKLHKLYNLSRVTFIHEGKNLLDKAFKYYIGTTIYHNLLFAKAGEESARVISMDSASKNANKMIDQLTLTMNRARQSIVTKELIEITTSAEAL